MSPEPAGEPEPDVRVTENTNDPSAPSYGPRGVDPVPLAVVDLNVGIIPAG